MIAWLAPLSPKAVFIDRGPVSWRWIFRRQAMRALGISMALFWGPCQARAQTRWCSGLTRGYYHYTTLGIWAGEAPGRAPVTREHPLVRGTSAWKDFPDPDHRKIMLGLSGLYLNRGWALGYEVSGGNSIGRRREADGGGRMRSTAIMLGGLARGGFVMMESGGWVVLPTAGAGYGLSGDRYRLDGLRQTPIGISDVHDDVIVWTHGPKADLRLEVFWTPTWQEGYIEEESRLTLSAAVGYRRLWPGRYWIVNDAIHQGELGGPVGVDGWVAGLGIGYGFVR